MNTKEMNINDTNEAKDTDNLSQAGNDAKCEEYAAASNTSSDTETGNENNVACVTDNAADTEHANEGTDDANADTDSNRQPETTLPHSKTASKPRGRFTFLKGVAFGIVLCLAAALLYRGYIYFPVGTNGEIFIKFPYYDLLHKNKETGELDATDINRKMDEITDLIKRNYLYEQNPQRISDGMFTGLIYGLIPDDSYAAYYSANNYETEKKNLKGSYVGIGVSVTKDAETGGIYVGEVTAGSPAEKAGIVAGDILLAADDTDLTPLSLDECVSLISGEEGTEVKLKVKRGEEELELTVKRETIKTETVRYSIVPKTNIGYLSISSFALNTEQDFYAAMDELCENKQVDGIIIDLRNNSGGDMNVVIRMVDSILADNLGDDGKTLILKTEDKAGREEAYYAEDGASKSIPINIVVNGQSASASEIFAGVLKDYGYEVTGTKTFGKGIVQSIFALSDGSAVKFTTDYYLLPNGERIHAAGIEPTTETAFEAYGDVEEKMVNYADGKTEPDFEQDVQLRTALDNLMEEIYS